MGKRSRVVFEGFTEKELKIIELRAVKELTPAEAGAMLGISRQAVNKLAHKIYRKSGTSSLEELREWAVDHGLDAPVPEVPAIPEVPTPRARTKRRVRHPLAGKRGPWRFVDVKALLGV